MTNKEQMVIDILKESQELYLRKNNDYGDSFGDTYKRFGAISALTRMNDKFNRLTRMILIQEGKIEGKTAVEDEKIEDTLQDLINYAAMTLAEVKCKAQGE